MRYVEMVSIDMRPAYIGVKLRPAPSAQRSGLLLLRVRRRRSAAVFNLAVH
jgi:hypothetical protein